MDTKKIEEAIKAIKIPKREGDLFTCKELTDELSVSHQTGRKYLRALIESGKCKLAEKISVPTISGHSVKVAAYRMVK